MLTHELLVHVRLERHRLEAWIQAGWLKPRPHADTQDFSEIDVARVQLIRDLQEDMGVNDEGIEIILDLVDQVYGLRSKMREILEAHLEMTQRHTARDPQDRE